MIINSPFKPSDLPIVNGKVYHLDLKPEEISKNIIIVGDPERVPFIADEFFSTKEVDRYHRGLRTITGHVKGTGQRVSIISSGMGTPSIEIVLNEIVALNELDFNTMTRKADYDMLTIIRVGTSGGIQHDTELGTLIITDYGVGLDNTGLFYNAPYFDENCKMLEEKIRAAVDNVIPHHSRFRGKIFPYASSAHRDAVKALEKETQRTGAKFKRGITVSNSGFFANQGRSVSQIPLTAPGVDCLLASINPDIEGLKIENMEMEASFLLHFMGALGYRAGVVCPVIDNRCEEKFLTQYTRHIKEAANIALKALYTLQ